MRTWFRPLSTLALASLGLGLTACLSPRVALGDAASRVVVGDIPPTNGMESLGGIEGVDGEGCGARGYEGTYDAALVRLKNEAAQRFADYVQVTGTAPPSFRPGCFDNHFTLTGIAYRRAGGAVSMAMPLASPTVPAAAAPAAAPATSRLPPVAASPMPAPPPPLPPPGLAPESVMPAPAAAATPPPVPAPPADSATARKLLELKDLRARNLISGEEYERLRRKVLSEAY